VSAQRHSSAFIVDVPIFSKFSFRRAGRARADRRPSFLVDPVCDRHDDSGMIMPVMMVLVIIMMIMLT